ncbi:competence protein ComE [Heyndrickxia sporothermodurans]|nr:competence protein ComE [Heyndrickxia sporothermodurans]
MKKIYENNKLLFIGLGVVILITIVFLGKKESEINSDEIDFSSPSEKLEKNEKEERLNSDNQKIIVDLKGEVMKPGIYEASPIDRIQDVITKAGGFKKNADQTQVNLALKVKDEMVIYVPKLGEKTNPINSISSSDSIDNDKVNINTANSEQLQLISGIGPSKAASIIEYREQNGPYKKIEEIKNVTGIGDKTFEKLKESITVD